ncbi:unnamed protein product [Rotaria socialis]|uniref:LanC-like protein 2 n=1 Tax=Rotaria socialis TaxID=392032 RepID=A0A817T1I1_9BILA|nr:unnamed protein product [Rotaria socialis]CAF3328915.1 unnamed protein product [Rotaria socialis]CAF3415210.1 unnamed protein product [Rotaria socialis]CAF3611692.1 unnamed protein product [Rotaria socialis]CAF3718225.1 unnamed protein product [Rotaria socialis]
MSDRYFENHYTDYNGETYLTSNNQLIPEIYSNVTHWIEHYIRKLERHIDTIDRSDGSVYTGSAGIALLYLHLAILFPSEKDNYKSKAKMLIDSALQQVNGKRISFLTGDPGPLAIAAVIYNDLNDERMVNKCIDKIISMKDDAASDSKPDEFLYGRTGYLYSLIFVRRKIRSDIIDNRIVTEVFESIIKSGEKYANETRSRSPLMYQWHDKEYMGAAHGVSGIIYLLLNVAQDDLCSNLRPYVQSHLLPTIEFLTTKRLPSGNYLSSSDSTTDRLVQWCHGATGFVFLFVRTYETTGNRSYLDLATTAGDVVWQRGLLRKGYGLCHGIAGNAYVFLDLYRATNNTKWLHRAIKFSEHCLDYGKHDISRTPDHPYSLFEGLSGTIYFMADIMNPKHARFPTLI